MSKPLSNLDNILNGKKKPKASNKKTSICAQLNLETKEKLEDMKKQARLKLGRHVTLAEILEKCIQKAPLNIL